MPLSFRQVGPGFAAEASGLDITKPISKSRLNLGSERRLLHASQLSDRFYRLYRTRAQLDAKCRGNL